MNPSRDRGSRRTNWDSSLIPRRCLHFHCFCSGFAEIFLPFYSWRRGCINIYFDLFSPFFRFIHSPLSLLSLLIGDTMRDAVAGRRRLPSDPAFSQVPPRTAADRVASAFGRLSLPILLDKRVFVTQNC